MHIEPKSCKLKLLGKLVIQHGTKAWFGRRSRVQPPSLQFAFPLFVYWIRIQIMSVYLSLHVREGVKEAYVLNLNFLLGKLVVQHFATPSLLQPGR